MQDSHRVATREANGLNTMQAMFVLHYVRTKNAVAAYRAAGYKADVNVSGAHALMSNPRVAAEIKRIEAEELERIRQRTGIDLESTLKSIARVAFADPRKLFHDDGRPKDISELDDDTAGAIEGIEVVENYAGTGEDRTFVGYTKKYKLARRSPAQDMLMKHLNGYKATQDGEAASSENALVNLLGSMRRSALPVANEVEPDENL
jgi:phage terminase small subunit